MEEQREVRPGWWFTTEGAEVAPARAHHQRFREKARPLGPRMPRLAAPPEGLAVAWGSPYAASTYPVGRNAPRLLGDLAALLRDDGAQDTVLARHARIYLDWHAGEEAAPGLAGLLAGHTRWARGARGRQRGHPNPLAFFLQPQRCERAAEGVRTFVARWGPLVVDFAGWLIATERSRVDRGHPLVEPLWLSPLARLGAEGLLWPSEWRRWVTSIRDRLSARHDPPLLTPVPVAFYLWAAAMLTALHRHPEWPGCQLFLANRLASMRLLPEGLLAAELTDEERARPQTAWLWGELLDYLALAATSLQRDEPYLHWRRCANPECDATFSTAHRGRRYCDACSGPKVHAVMASRRYRARKQRQQ
jgi:hypothetical protein